MVEIIVFEREVGHIERKFGRGEWGVNYQRLVHHVALFA